MGFKMGIVGLPNVGKSTLFNALTKTAAAQAANFPFCTIEPNVGEVGVPDLRLDTLANLAGSKQTIPARITFVDIAGLVKGASQGEGLGNQFLANIRECDAIAHVLRCFEDDDITHVDGRVDPIEDAETIETELMLADLDSIERRLQNLARKLKGGDKEAITQDRLLRLAKETLENGQPARVVDVVGQQSNRNGRPPSQRMLQVGENIRRSLSALLQRQEVHDPELQSMLLTVSEVKMTSDLRVATAYVLPLGGKDKDLALKALRRNTREIRHLVVKGGRQKVAPELRFELDLSFDQMDATRALLESDHVRRDLES